jgi:class 3 adenylate cyclase
MHKSVQNCWIAEAEARRVREFAQVQRAVSEPYVSIVHTRAGPGWFDSLRELVTRLAFTAPGQQPSFANNVMACEASSVEELRDLRAEARADRVLATVLFTDIVESTKRAAEMGDRHWRALLDRHDDAIRYQIARFRGREVKNLGDGFLATFSGPARAIRCASAIIETIAPLGIAVRSGLHTGEVELRRNDISGIAVHIAARIAAMAHPGQPLVSSTVRDLVAGSDLVFQDRGLHVLQGLPEEIRLYAVSAVSDPLARIIHDGCGAAA